MKKIIVASDSHCNSEALKYIVSVHPDAICYLHAGDSQDYESNIFPFVTVKGNGDYFIIQESKIITIEHLKIYLCHGHKMYLNEENMVRKAKEKECNMFVFGHTHRPFYRQVDGIHLLNPGSISYPRTVMGPTYAIIYLKENNEIDVTFETF